MRIVDATARLVRAPEVRFSAEEIGLDAFGQNIENRHLVAALDSRAAAIESLMRIADEAVAVERSGNGIAVSTKDGDSITAPLRAGALGRRRRTPLALSRRCRHRKREPQLSPDRADLQSRPQPAASRHLDRVSH